MADNGDADRDALHEAIQRNSPTGRSGAVLTGWALVAEWMDPDGERWLSRAYSPTITAWQAKGMWHEALFGYWPSGDDDG